MILFLDKSTCSAQIVKKVMYQISPFSAFLIENPQTLGKIKGKTPFSLKKPRIFTVIGREYVGRESTINLMRKGMGQQGHTTVKAT